MRRPAAWLLPVLLSLPPLAGCGPKEPPMHRPSAAPRTAVVQAAGRDVTVELALDEASRERGLMHRTRLDPDAGMLFVFPDVDERFFWMKNWRDIGGRIGCDYRASYSFRTDTTRFSLARGCLNGASFRATRVRVAAIAGTDALARTIGRTRPRSMNGLIEE